MQDEETNKVINDQQVYKEKIEKQKIEMHDLKKKIKKLEKKEKLYNVLKD